MVIMHLVKSTNYLSACFQANHREEVFRPPLFLYAESGRRELMYGNSVIVLYFLVQNYDRLGGGEKTKL